MSSFHFQVNLRAIIEILSSHLYSGPQVFVREMLQNSVDAIRARRLIDKTLDGKVDFELSAADGVPTLIVEDNGVGLTLEEVHNFVATIGSSSKREDLAGKRAEYIGQFGIGLLSCFIVSEEIVLVTCSVKPGSKPVEWRGRADGTYTVRELESTVSPGTKVYLRCAPGKEKFFEFETLLSYASNYGSLLPFTITLSGEGRTEVVNVAPPWRSTHLNEREKNAAYMEYGTTILEDKFFDYIPLSDEHGDFEGAAYILPYTPNPAARKNNRVYLKDMLISAEADNLLPEWAFFVKCVVNTKTLCPTASREALVNDASLEAIRDGIGSQLKDYVVRLANFDRNKLQRFLAIHALTIKQLSIFDDEFLLLFIDHLQFQTSLGELTLPECRKRSSEISYVADVDEFKQVADIASAQGICVINGGYVFNQELLERFSALRPAQAVPPISVNRFVQQLADVDLKKREAYFELLRTSDKLLQRFHVRTDLRQFEPATLPVLFVASRDSLFRRSAEQAVETTDAMWGGIVGNILDGAVSDEYPSLCFNAANSFVQRLAAKARTLDAAKLKQVIEVLYLQSLLLGRRPLSQAELAVLNEGISSLMDGAIGREPTEDIV